MINQTQHWARFAHSGAVGFGTVEDGRIRVHKGDMFDAPQATDEYLSVDDVRLLRPIEPSKVIALWNNFGELSSKLGLSSPPEPLYLLKAPNSFADPDEVIRQPRCGGKVAYEGELGIVIGRTATAVSVEDALDYVFGYTCGNDVTQADILNRDASFAQWVRAKGFDTFCPMGPVVATGLDADALVVKTILNGTVRQQYPISDMHFSVARLVSLISADMTLNPGDVILCGTSVGIGSMKPGSEIVVEIEGIGRLCNLYQ